MLTNISPRSGESDPGLEFTTNGLTSSLTSSSNVAILKLTDHSITKTFHVTFIKFPRRSLINIAAADSRTTPLFEAHAFLAVKYLITLVALCQLCRTCKLVGKAIN